MLGRAREGVSAGMRAAASEVVRCPWSDESPVLLFQCTLVARSEKYDLQGACTDKMVEEGIKNDTEDGAALVDKTERNADKGEAVDKVGGTIYPSG